MRARIVSLICIVSLGILWLSVPCIAQDTLSDKRFVVAGFGYFAEASPQFQGVAALGVPLTSDGKAISYTDIKIGIVDSGGQFNIAGVGLRYTMHPGIAYRIYQYNSWSLWGLAAPGFAVQGDALVGSFEYGGFICKGLGKGWGIMGVLSAEKTGDVTDFAPILAITKKF